MTYKTLLEHTKQTLPDMAAEYLLQGLTNKKRYELYSDNTSVPKELVAQVNALLKRKKPDVPIQYLLHKTYFLSYEFHVDKRVMIPRFETEGLVMKTVDRLRAQRSALNAVLDIGTGSGAIAIAVADLFPQTRVVATDISAEALEVAKMNIKKYKLEDRIGLYHADLFSVLNEKFDLIISNPPYVSQNEIERLPSVVKSYEPRIALNGGKDGFEIIERIIKQAPLYLSCDGLVALEIDPRQVNLINNLSCGSDFPVAISMLQFEKDNQGMFRYVFIKYEK